MQLQLPLFQDGVHLITRDLGYRRDGEQITYFQGVMPVFTHEIEDVASFQMITSQFYVNGNVKQMDIVRAFGIKSLALKRWVKKYLKEGPFFKILFHPTLESQALDPKSSDNIHLFDIAIHIELAGDHLKRSDVLNFMSKHGHHSLEICDLFPVSSIAKIPCNQVDAILK